MDEERPSGSDAILDVFLTQVILTEQSADKHNPQRSADKSRKRDALIATCNSSPDAHKWVDDSSVTECTQIIQCQSNLGYDGNEEIVGHFK